MYSGYWKNAVDFYSDDIYFYFTKRNDDSYKDADVFWEKYKVDFNKNAVPFLVWIDSDGNAVKGEVGSMDVKFMISKGLAGWWTPPVV